MCKALAPGNRGKFFIADDCHPQTIAVVQARAHAIGVECVVGNPTTSLCTLRSALCAEFAGVLVQYPTTDGRIIDYTDVVATVPTRPGRIGRLRGRHPRPDAAEKSPGAFGADIAVGSQSQRFGVPMGFGGPSAAFMATRTEFARKMPGRIVGLSKDAQRQPGPAAGDPDPRAAHPPGQGDQQHLHRPGPAGQHRRAVRRLPRAARPDPDRHGASTA